MKKSKIILLIYLTCIMFSACSSKDSSSKDSSINHTPSTPAKEDVFDLQQNDSKVYRFSWGYDVFRPGEEMGIYQEEGQLVRSTVYKGGELPLGVSIFINKDDSEPINFGLLVLVDGLPVEFTPEGERQATYMHPFQVIKDTICKFTLTPTFQSEAGRIDIIIAADLMNIQGDTAVLPLYVDNQSGEYNNKNSNNPVHVLSIPSDFQASPQSGDAHIPCWIYQADTDESMHTGQSATNRINLSSDGNEWLYESTTGLPGELRTIFFLDYKPYIVLNDKPYVDWSPSYGEMLSLPITFSDIEDSSIFMPVTIRMDDTDMKHQTLILRRFLINP
jgi:hypothetical protein